MLPIKPMAFRRGLATKIAISRDRGAHAYVLLQAQFMIQNSVLKLSWSSLAVGSTPWILLF